MGCWEHPMALRECIPTQHSDIISYHGPIISVFRENGNGKTADRLGVRVDFFKAVLSFKARHRFLCFRWTAGAGRGPPRVGLLENIK